MCLLAAPARGQTAVSFDCETNAACAALYEQAAQQSKAGQLVEAEKSYKLAYEVSHDARLLFNIARVLDKRGQEPEAIAYYRRFLEAPLSDEEQKAKARTYVEQLEAKAAARRVAPTAPTLAPTTVPAGTPTPSEEQNGKPVYKKGWFWGVLVGSVAAVGLGIGLGVGLSNRGPTVPSGTNTIEGAF
jgi:tetratricopeptide (TPR) repeat protein